MAERASKTVDDYIAGFPADVRRRLKQMRATIRKAAPSATETISYSIPAFKMNRMLVWYAAFSNHIGFYPGAGGVAHFKDELSSYRFAKGSIQFPFDKPLPLALVTRIVKFRVRACR
ncbi:MAG TPA: DUF1801 domain-containing protein [Candidatus Eremiobacteraceae bacterium]|nr:DUF1801 domain-containing protein [Candidatus Eremiobacteraceae bacterium]